MKEEIDSNTIIVGDFNTPLTPMDRSSRQKINKETQALNDTSFKWQKINKETQALNDTIDHIDLIDIYRTFHPKVAEYTFFSSTHGILPRRDHLRSQIKLRKI